MRLHIEGSGPWLMLHGVAGSARTYSFLDVAAVRFDFRGHGASDRAPGTYVLEGYVEDALSVLSSVGRATLVGHSLGGVTAWTVAQRRPDLVERILLEDPPLFMGEPAEHAASPAIPEFVSMRADVVRWQQAGTSAEQVTRELAAERLPDGRPYTEFQTPEALASRGYALTHLDPEVLDRVIDGALLASADTVSPVEVPVFILAADDATGAAFTSAHEERLAATHPDVEVTRLDGASHTIHDESRFRDEWLRWVTSRA